MKEKIKSIQHATGYPNMTSDCSASPQHKQINENKLQVREGDEQDE